MIASEGTINSEIIKILMAFLPLKSKLVNANAANNEVINTHTVSIDDVNNVFQKYFKNGAWWKTCT